MVLQKLDLAQFINILAIILRIFQRVAKITHTMSTVHEGSSQFQTFTRSVTYICRDIFVTYMSWE